jgi:hypothetical protein
MPRRPTVVLLALWGLYFHPLILHPTHTLFAPYSDLLAEHLPARIFLVREWHATGELPLWNPYHFCGSPFVHDIQVGVFYPPYAATFLFPESAAGAGMSWVVALHVLAAGGCAAVYARSLGMGEVGCTVAGVGWMFAGKWMTHLLLAGHTITIGLAWLPLIVLGLERGARTGGIGPALGAGAALALMILGTHPQWTFYAGVFAALWTVPHDRAAVRRWQLTGVGAVGVALALAAVQLLPTIEASRWTTRAGGVVYTGAFGLSFPTLLGLGGPGAVYDPPGSWENRGVFGAVWLAAALAGGSRWRRGVVIGMAFFAVGGAVVVNWLPGFNLFRVPSRMLLVTGFPVGVLAATTIDRLARSGWGDPGRAEMRRLIPLLAAFLLVPSLGGAVYGWWVTPPRPPWWPGLLGWAAILAAAPVAYWLLRDEPPRGRGRLAALLGVMLVEWVAPTVLLVATKPQADIYLESTATAFVKSQLTPGSGRVSDADLGGENPAERYSALGMGAPLTLTAGVESPRGYNPLDVRHYREFAARAEGDDDDVVPFSAWAFPVVPPFQGGRPALFDLLNTRYLIWPAGEPVDSARWEAVVEDAGPAVVPPIPPEPPDRLVPHTVYRSRTAFPRAWVVPGAATMPHHNDGPALAATDYRKVVLLAPGRPLPPAVEVVPAARITEYRPNRVRVELDGGGGGFLVLGDVWYPGWVCRVDGVEVSVERANHTFRAVELPAGAREAVFVFEPRSYRVGWWVSVAAVALLVITPPLAIYLARERA